MTVNIEVTGLRGPPGEIDAAINAGYLEPGATIEDLLRFYREGMPTPAIALQPTTAISSIAALKAKAVSSADNGVTVMVKRVIGRPLAYYFVWLANDTPDDFNVVRPAPPYDTVGRWYLRREQMRRIALTDLGWTGGLSVDAVPYILDAQEKLGDIGGTIDCRGDHLLLEDADTDGICLLLSRSVYLEFNKVAQVVQAAAGLDPDTDIIVWRPAGVLEFAGIEGLHLANETNGNRTGRHGLHLDTAQAAGSQFNRFLFRRSYIGVPPNSAARGIYANNNPTLNPNGGLTTAIFEDFALGCGVELIETGDKLKFRDGSIRGAGVGFTLTQIDAAAGASCCNTLEDVVITSSGGAIKVNRARGLKIKGGIYENGTVGETTQTVADNDGYVFNFAGTAGRVSVTIDGFCAVRAGGTSNATHLINFGNVNGVHIGAVELGIGNLTVKAFRGVAPVRDGSGVITTPGARNVHIAGPLLFPESSGIYPFVVERIFQDLQGEGMRGYGRFLGAAANGWTPIADYDQPQYVAEALGSKVKLAFAVQGGTNTAGTVLWVLGPGYRPSSIQHVDVTALDSGGAGIAGARLEVAGDGRVLLYAPGASKVFCNGEFTVLTAIGAEY